MWYVSQLRRCGDGSFFVDMCMNAGMWNLCPLRTVLDTFNAIKTFLRAGSQGMTFIVMQSQPGPRSFVTVRHPGPDSECIWYGLPPFKAMMRCTADRPKSALGIYDGGVVLPRNRTTHLASYVYFCRKICIVHDVAMDVLVRTSISRMDFLGQNPIATRD